MSVTSIQTQNVAVRKRRWQFNSAILLGVPYIAFMLVFGIVPMILALIFSFSKYGGFQPEYLAAGVSNYLSIFTDPQLKISFGNILKFAAVALPVSFLGAVGVALIMNLADDALGRFMRTVYFIPGAITLPAVALIMVFMFDPGISPFAPILKIVLGVQNYLGCFVSNAPKAVECVKDGVELRNFFAYMGNFMGFRGLTAGDIINNNSLIAFMVILRFFAFSGGWIAIFYGALTGINREVIEAGMIDGCGPWQMALYIKRPLIMGYVFFMLITLTIQSLQLFAEPFILSTSLRTVSPIDQYWSPNMWAQFITVRTGDFGKSAVVSLIMLFISLIAAVTIVTRTGFFKTDVARN
jgi:multiple sugar transport system permease protein